METTRATIRRAAPDAKEAIGYRMPTFNGNAVLVHFAAFKNHIGLDPPVFGDAVLVTALALTPRRKATRDSRSAGRSRAS